MTPAHEHNRRAWDERARRGLAHAEPATEWQLRHPLTVIDQCGWLGDVAGKRVLCLAAGGGKQAVLFAAAGAQVTVVDLSPQMLELDRQRARELGLKVTSVEASMDHLPMLAEASFEVVIQPVSTCYVPDVAAVYREVARVTVAGGLYVSQHKQPACLQAAAQPTAGGYLVSEPYHRQGPLPAATAGLGHREAGTVEYLHRWEELLGGLCRAGFVIEDVVESRHADAGATPGSFGHRSHYLPPFVTLKARRTNQRITPESANRLWVPGA